MNTLTPEKMLENWEYFLNIINKSISSPRKEQLLKFYKKHEEELVIMPASNKRSYHNAIPGGYIDHVNRVCVAALKIMKVWETMGTDMSTFTQEELIFSAINHDLGKMGDDDGNYIHIPQTDSWRKKNLGETYSFNKALAFMKVPDRGLYLLQKNNIPVTENEYIAIKTHDGLYDEGNNSYYKSFMPETKFRTSMPHILHQADLLAAFVEFESEYKNEFKNSLESPKEDRKLKSKSIKQAALNTIKSKGLKGTIDNI